MLGPGLPATLEPGVAETGSKALRKSETRERRIVEQETGAGCVVDADSLRFPDAPRQSPGVEIAQHSTERESSGACGLGNAQATTYAG